MTHPSDVTSGTANPDYVTALELVYGAPSQAGFGSAVFYGPLSATADLEAAALAKYRFFVGPLWERYGETAWLRPWQQVYTRPRHAFHGIVAELRAIEDRAASQSAALIVDDVENAEAALSAAFDAPTVTELTVYKLGDGGAMGGILIAARRQVTDEALFLIFLID